MTLTEVRGYRLYTFPSFESYLNRAASPEFKIQRYGNGSLWGTPKFDEMLYHARHGWTNSLGDISKWADMLVEDISTHLPKPELVFDKVGSMWDLDRLLTSDPESWVREVETQHTQPYGSGNIVRLVVNTASSAACRTLSHKHRCGAILALTQLLEMCGYFVQFEITTAINHGRYNIEFRTTAKQAGESLNLAAVSFWCSYEMEQHVDFSVCETLPELSYKHRTHYGTPICTVDGGDICFDEMHASKDRVDWNSEQSVRRYIVGKLKKQGVKFTS